MDSFRKLAPMTNESAYVVQIKFFVQCKHAILDLEFPSPHRHGTVPATIHTLQRTATHSNTLQHTATDCNALQHWQGPLQDLGAPPDLNCPGTLFENEALTGLRIMFGILFGPDTLSGCCRGTLYLDRLLSRHSLWKEALYGLRILLCEVPKQSSQGLLGWIV